MSLSNFIKETLDILDLNLMFTENCLTHEKSCNRSFLAESTNELAQSKKLSRGTTIQAFKAGLEIASKKRLAFRA